MADNSSVVTISGAALSLLLYENARSVGDQMGFLLGNVLTYVTKSLTDAEHQLESVKNHIDIQSILTCPSTDYLYDSCGKLNIDKLRNFVKDKSKRIVGWFRFRKQPSLVPTLRDKIIHKQLARFYSDNNDFVACMMNVASTTLNGTHKFRHVFFNYSLGQYQPVPLSINNLGYDATKRDGADYKIAPSNFGQSDLDLFTLLNLDLAQTPGILSAERIQKAAEERLESLVAILCKTDTEVAELELKICSMKEHILASKLENFRSIKTDPFLSDESFHSPKQKNMIEQKNFQSKISNSMNASKEYRSTTSSNRSFSTFEQADDPAQSINMQRPSYSSSMKKESDMES